MITVLLPTYNSKKYIHEAIKSILNQTYKNFEFLILDDGSDDNTEKIINSFNDNRIRYIKKKHSGLADTLNYGLKNAKYDWIARMDADDISHPSRLAEQIRFNNNKSNTVVFSKSAFFQNSSLAFEYVTPTNINEIKKNLMLHSPIPHPTVLYNRKFILDHGGYDNSLIAFEDYDLWLKIMNFGNFIFIPKFLVFQRIRNESLSTTNSNSNSRIIYNIQSIYYQEMYKHFGVRAQYKQLQFKGWREYFFGNPKLARKYWFRNVRSLCNPRILMATFIISLPETYIEQFKRSRVKLKIKFFLYKIIGRNKVLERNFKESLQRNNYNPNGINNEL